jgi:hypothetical protein
VFSKIINHLYLGDEQDYFNLKKSNHIIKKPYLFVDARPFFNILSGDANAKELMICPLNALAASLAVLIANGVTVYIYCQAGMERSPFVAALTLFQLVGEPRQTLEECYREVAQKRPETIIYPQWVEAMQCVQR